MKLSILICSLYRRKDFLKKLKNKLLPQVTNEVEILYDIDDGAKTIGQKRNQLLDKSQGKYIVFIDDDDLVSDDYVSKILEGIDKDVDVIGIHLIMNVDGKYDEYTYHSLKYRTWYHEADPTNPGRLRYFRNPNHLNPVKREYAMKAKFPQINNGEDKSYSMNLLQYLKTEHYIESPIYYYMVRSHKDV